MLQLFMGIHPTGKGARKRHKPLLRSQSAGKSMSRQLGGLVDANALALSQRLPAKVSNWNPSSTSISEDNRRGESMQ